MTVRGGRDQFDWNKIKDDKHYQNYLGHSLKAPVGRWQNDKDLEWFNKAGESDESKRAARLDEIRKIKEAEEEAVAAALGHAYLPPKLQSADTVPAQVHIRAKVPEEDFSHGSRSRSQQDARRPRKGSRQDSRSPSRSHRSRHHHRHHHHHSHHEHDHDHDGYQRRQRKDDSRRQRE